MADGNVIDILLRFLVDQGSQKQAQAAIDNIGKGKGAGSASGATAIFGSDTASLANNVAQTMKQLGISSQEAANNIASMNPEFGKTGEQILADVAAMQALGTESAATAEAVSGIEKNTTRMNSTFRSGGAMMGGFMLARAGQYLTQIGQGLLTTPVDAYAKYAGQTSGASREWLNAQKDLEQSTVRIGGVLTSQVAPVMHTIAGMVSSIADLFEKYPALGAATAGLGATALVGGTVLKVLGEILTTLAAVKMAGGISGLFNLGGGVAAGAGAAAGAAGAGTAAAGTGVFAGLIAAIGPLVVTLLPLAVAIGALIALLNTQFGKQGVNAGAQLLTMGAYGLGSLISPEVAAQWGQSIGHLTGAIDNLGNSSQNAAGKVSGAADAIQSQQEVDAFIAFQQEESQAAQQYEQQRVDIVKNAGEERTQAEQKYEDQRAKLIEDYKTTLADESANYARQTATAARGYYQQEVQYEQDYYKQRTKAAASYGLDVQRAEEDHQRQMLQMQEDHANRVEDLLATHDAFGMYTEMRDYEKSRSRSESDYSVESKRRSEDFALRISDMEGQFVQERARRQADYNQQRADAETQYNLQSQQRAKQLEGQLTSLDADHKTEMAALAKQETDKLTQLQQQYAQEETDRSNALAKQLGDLGAYLNYETDLRAKYYTEWGNQFQDFMSKNGVKLQQQAYPAKAAGGYASYGLYQLGDSGNGPGPEEYVMNGGLTSLAEKLSGGRLTNNKIATLLLGNQGGTQIIYNDQKRIDGRVTAADRRWVREDTMSAIEEAFGG